jgi:hypothetical protein
MMAEPLYIQAIRQLEQAASLSCRLVLVDTPSDAVKSVVVQEVAAWTDTLVMNVNLALSQRMLDHAELQRSLQVPRLLEESTGQVDEARVVPRRTPPWAHAS